MPEGNDINVLTIDAPLSTVEYHQWPKSGPEGKPVKHSEIENWKEGLHSMICRFQVRATEFKNNWLWQLKWKKILEVISLTCTIITVWVMFMIPSIIFAVKFSTAKEVSHI